MEQTPPNPRFREAITAALRGQRLMQYLGCELTHIEPGFAVAEVALKPQHEQQLGIVHGGLIATLADVAAGFASFTLTPEGFQPVTTDLHVLFFQPGRGERLQALGRVLHAGNRLHFAEARILCLCNGTETLIAQATSTLALIRVPTQD
ncbi:MAG: PaaI family thioesterase [Candidatus Kapabacteria bacterium]|nr:PaaI family thioesterase [Candidatus Kapabacteria bacterium]MCS7170455.1 PaaI family thioesterase [Candidatus Kapabacteria bacterium]MDW7996511.1 PaaI family thioesterase [Bacteroidota bacterium]MDW8224654.1 PaaI family thioesterase [Bacteroidota bacterium]